MVRFLWVILQTEIMQLGTITVLEGIDVTNGAGSITIAGATSTSFKVSIHLTQTSLQCQVVQYQLPELTEAHFN